MFVRHKKNKTGTISIQVVDKSHGYSKVLKSFGFSSDPDVISKLEALAYTFIEERSGCNLSLFDN